MAIRDTAAQFGLTELKRPEVVLFQSREDFERLTGKPAPPYNAALPDKYWTWKAPVSGKVVSFLVPAVIDGQPALTNMTVPLAYAQSVNIAHGEANAQEQYAAGDLAFPVEPLRPDEYLALAFSGIIVVRNRNRFAEPVEAFERKALALLEKIAAKLGA